MAVDWNVPPWRNVRRVGNVLGTVIGIIGLGGLPDDIRNWGMAFNAVATILSHDIVRTGLCLLGLTIIVVVNLPKLRGLLETFHGVTASPSPATITTVVKSTALPKIPRFTPATIADFMLHRRMVREGKTGSNDPADSIPPMRCPLCKGSGLKWNRIEAICSKCGGTGELPGELSHYPKCQICKGTGHKFGRIEAECDVCAGYGVRIPDLRYRHA
ncbi:MAG: hypothetical protein AB7G28_03305 [Pirellulales bacterium]